MYKGQHTEIMTSNGIHLGWETLPPLKDPDTLKEQAICSTEHDFACMPVEMLILPPKIVRCQEKSLFTEEDYKKMEDERYFSEVDPSIMENIEEWETTFQAQEMRDRREQSKKVEYL